MTRSPSLNSPILGTWRVDGYQEKYPGVLIEEQGSVYLTVFLEITDPAQHYGNSLELHPRLLPFQPPRQPTVFGESKAVGKVTLFGCVLSSTQIARQFNPLTAYVEIKLLVQQAWAGGDLVERCGNYKALRLTAAGLHQVLSASRLEGKLLVASTADHMSPTNDLKNLTGADQAFLFFPGIWPTADIVHLGKSYKVIFSTLVGGSWSSTDGDQVLTTDHITIESSGATLFELTSVAYQIEQFISLL